MLLAAPSSSELTHTCHMWFQGSPLTYTLPATNPAQCRLPVTVSTTCRRSQETCADLEGRPGVQFKGQLLKLSVLYPVKWNVKEYGLYDIVIELGLVNVSFPMLSEALVVMLQSLQAPEWAPTSISQGFLELSVGDCAPQTTVSACMRFVNSLRDIRFDILLLAPDRPYILVRNS